MAIGNLLALLSETPWMTLPSSLDAKAELVKAIYANPSMAMETKMHPAFAPKIELVGRTAILSIEGEMVHKCDDYDTLFGFQSTSKVHEMFLDLANDRTIDQICLYFDCVGGSVIGGAEFAEDIWNCEKPVIAFTDGYMTSLAYLWGSACDKIYATPTSQVGSIGVILQVWKAKYEGIELYSFKAGEKKDYGSPYTEISENEINYFQNKVNYSYEQFVNAVSLYRSWGVEEIIATQAGYDSAGAMPFFVDEIITKKEFIKNNF